MTRRQWLAQQRTRLLPVPYFLVTFTVPEQLREPIRAAMKPWYGALLKESAGALQDLAADPKHLGAELGITAMLQTWTRDLRYHPHVHLLVPGGGLTPNRLRWVRVPDPAVPPAASEAGRTLQGPAQGVVKTARAGTVQTSPRQSVVAEMGRGHAAGGQRRGGVKISGQLSVPAAARTNSQLERGRRARRDLPLSRRTTGRCSAPP